MSATAWTFIAGSDKAIGTHLPTGSSTLALAGARGETLNFQFHGVLDGCATFKLQDLPGVDTRFFRMDRVITREASFKGATVGAHFDPLIPQDATGGKICPNAPSAGGSVETWIWGETRIAPGVKPGVLKGRITMGAKTLAPVELEVWNLEMPRGAHAMPMHAEYGSWYGVLGHYGKWAKAEVELDEQYQAAMLDHRILPYKAGVERPEIGLNERGDPILKTDQSRASGAAFDDLVLGRLPEWASVDFPTFRREDTREQRDRWWRAIQGTLLRKGLHYRAWVYLWDEPGKEDIAPLVLEASRIQALAPDLKVMVTHYWDDRLDSVVDIFAPLIDRLGEPGSAEARKFRELQSRGKEVWAYVSCMSHGCDGPPIDRGTPDWVLDRPTAWIRSLAWIGMKIPLNGLLYYNVNEAYKHGLERDPWKSLWDFTGNGDGTLFYPGRPGEHGLQQHQPIPSVRLKAWREASFDAEYIRWMNEWNEAPSWWKQEWATIVRSPTQWERSYSKYAELRLKMGRALSARKR